jgi:acetyl/propionyl-CoA carboxylase alpha subunit/acetyl-CoA carboxylase carboxyltransferase component
VEIRRIGIVNRGEAATRCLAAISTLRWAEANPPESVAMYTDADSDALFVRLADKAVRIGAGRAAYLDAEGVLAALQASGCDAAWLGWGFASEDAGFAKVLEDGGINLLAPRSETMHMLGDKISAKQLAEKHDVPVAPWAICANVEEAIAAAPGIGFPLLVKAAGGGGGRGIRRVDAVEEVAEAFVSARDEAARSFKSHGIMLELCVEGARHIEVQVLGDGKGQIEVLGLRDCSLQRRRQKVIEEAPAPRMPLAIEQAAIDGARRLCGAVNYRSAGTVEYLYDTARRRLYFLEVNTRLQVEHPVTELVYGVDLVKAQIDIARGRPPVAGRPRGWAVEARICAEDAQRDFMPSPGKLARFLAPTGPGLRMDTGFTEGDVIAPEFDALIAKLIAWGPDRPTAMARLADGLRRTQIVVEGGTTNLAFLRDLLGHPEMRAGRAHTGLVDALTFTPPPGAGIAALAAAIDRFMRLGDTHPGGVDRHQVEAGVPLAVYRVAPDSFRVVSREGALTVTRRSEGPFQVILDVDGTRYRVARAPGDDTYVVDGVPHRVAAASGGSVPAPSAALVLSVPVQAGDRVAAGACVAVVESMKMEVKVTTARAGVVREIRVDAGQQVSAGQVLVVIEPESEAVAPTGLPDVPWDAKPLNTAAERLTQAVIGWDRDPQQFPGDCSLLLQEDGDLKGLLHAFADIAELFERRPDPDADGAAEAVTTALWIETLRRRGPSSLSTARQSALLTALSHHEIDDLDAADLDDPLRRLERAGLALPLTMAAVVAALGALKATGRSPIRLLDRLAGLDASRFAAVCDAADRTRYRLFERPAFDKLCARADARAAALLAHLRSGEADWPELLAAPESLLAGTAPQALAGCAVAAEAVALRMEWRSLDEAVTPLTLAGRQAFRVGVAPEARVVVTCGAIEAPEVLRAAASLPDMLRLDLVVVAAGADADAVLDDLEPALDLGAPRPVPWRTLCLIAVTGPGLPSVRRFDGVGIERPVCRDLMPSTVHRLDLDRLEHFEFKRLASESEVVLFHAKGRANPDDTRLMAYGEIRSLARASGSPLHLPHVERVFHTAVRAIQAARDTHDPRRRMQWNRITLVVLPIVPGGVDVLRSYVARIAPAATRVGLEAVVIRARFADPKAPGGVTPPMDLSIGEACGGLQYALRPAQRDPLLPITAYESKVISARRRGQAHPYEIINYLEGGGIDIAPGRFEEFDLDEQGRLNSVAGRPAGLNQSGVVVGVMRTRPSDSSSAHARVLLLSDPTRHMGALAEAECDRIVQAIDLAERLGVPLEWVAVSAGARIDWQTGTENLDWTARVLKRIVDFTQSDGEINIIVPGICVGAQAYWNAEATMMMHTRGLLIMTEQGSMVLTGKRALDFSGCVSAEDDLALGGYANIMGPNGQAQAYAPDLASAYRLLYRHYALTYVAPGARRPQPWATSDAPTRDISAAPYPADLGHDFETIGQIFSAEHNPDRKRPFAVRPVMKAVMDADVRPVERWGGMRDAETAVVWETRVGGYAATLIGIENRPVARLGQRNSAGPDALAAGTLYPQAARKIARALNTASGRRPAVVVANLSGFDGSPESLANWQLEYGAEIGRAVVNFKGPIIFAVVSRYHGGAYVVFSKALNADLHSLALEGSFASVIGGAPAAAVVFGREVKQRTRLAGGGKVAKAEATAAVAAEFDAIHTVQRARKVGSIDAIIPPMALRPHVIAKLAQDAQRRPSVAVVA